MHLVLDTETTGKLVKGLPPFHERQPWLMELGAVLFDDQFHEVDYLVMLCRLPANVTVEPGAFEAHGITAAHCNSLGEDPDKVLTLFNQLIARAQYVWAYNMAFDSQILLGAYVRARMPYGLQTAKTLCAMELMTPHCKIPAPWGSGYKWPRLQQAHVHATGHEFDGAHSALADVRATGRVLKWLSGQANWPLGGSSAHPPSPAQRASGRGATGVTEGKDIRHVPVNVNNSASYDSSVPTVGLAVPANERHDITVERPTFHIPIAHIQTR